MNKNLFLEYYILVKSFFWKRAIYLFILFSTFLYSQELKNASLFLGGGVSVYLEDGASVSVDGVNLKKDNGMVLSGDVSVIDAFPPHSKPDKKELGSQEKTRSFADFYIKKTKKEPYLRRTVKLQKSLPQQKARLVFQCTNTKEDFSANWYGNDNHSACFSTTLYNFLKKETGIEINGLEILDSIFNAYYSSNIKLLSFSKVFTVRPPPYLM